MLNYGVPRRACRYGIVMLGACNWASVKPMRKLYFNSVFTAVAILVAMLVGGIEVLGLMP